MTHDNDYDSSKDNPNHELRIMTSLSTKLICQPQSLNDWLITRSFTQPPSQPPMSSALTESSPSVDSEITVNHISTLATWADQTVLNPSANTVTINCWCKLKQQLSQTAFAPCDPALRDQQSQIPETPSLLSCLSPPSLLSRLETPSLLSHLSEEQPTLLSRLSEPAPPLSECLSQQHSVQCLNSISTPSLLALRMMLLDPEITAHPWKVVKIQEEIHRLESLPFPQTYQSRHKWKF